MTAHSHCPLDCEHPQPFKLADEQPPEATARGFKPGGEYCGRCWHRNGDVTEMVPCTPETCPGETP